MSMLKSPTFSYYIKNVPDYVPYATMFSLNWKSP